MSRGVEATWLIPVEAYPNLVPRMLHALALSGEHDNGKTLAEIALRDQDRVLATFTLPSVYPGSFGLHEFFLTLHAATESDATSLAELVWSGLSVAPIENLRRGLGYILDQEVAGPVDFHLLWQLSHALTGSYSEFKSQPSPGQEHEFIEVHRHRVRAYWRSVYGDLQPWWENPIVQGNLVVAESYDLRRLESRIGAARRTLATLQQTYVACSQDLELFDANQWETLLNFIGGSQETFSDMLRQSIPLVTAISSC